VVGDDDARRQPLAATGEIRGRFGYRMRLSRLLAIVGLIAAFTAVGVVDATAGKKKTVKTTVTAQWESPPNDQRESYIVGSVHINRDVRTCLERTIDVIADLFYIGNFSKVKSGADGRFRIGPVFVVPNAAYHVQAVPKKVGKKTCKSGVTTIYGPFPTPYP
jgi:hypothetical protein